MDAFPHAMATITSSILPKLRVLMIVEISLSGMTVSVVVIVELSWNTTVFSVLPTAIATHQSIDWNTFRLL